MTKSQTNRKKNILDLTTEGSRMYNLDSDLYIINKMFLKIIKLIFFSKIFFYREYH